MKHRISVVASILVLIVGSAAALSLYGIFSARASLSIPAGLNSVPEDYQFIMGFNVQRLTASPFYERRDSRHGFDSK